MIEYWMCYLFVFDGGKLVGFILIGDFVKSVIVD